MKRLAFCLSMLVVLSGCGSFELSDSPFQRITRAQPKKGYLVAVQARLVPTFSHVFSPLVPKRTRFGKPPARDWRLPPGFAVCRWARTARPWRSPTTSFRLNTTWSIIVISWGAGSSGARYSLATANMKVRTTIRVCGV